jgi:peptidoglycan/LPS O-acetylase OafA/YrhL
MFLLLFAGTSYAILNGALWTIQYEFICYSLIALFGVFGLLKNRFFLFFCFLGTLITRFIIVWGYDLLLPIKAFETTFLINSHALLKFISFFFAGSCFYLFREKFSFSRRNALIAAVIVIVNLFWDKSAEILLSTVGAYLLLYFAFTNFPFLQRFSKWADISYGVYLYAWPIQKLFLWNYPSLSPWLLFMLTFGCSYACGFLSWHLIEQPFLRLKKKTFVVKIATE